jgi:flavin reductase (DIM6/NTAB) family NADH-FMN oxidoreductase RutF
MIFFEPQSRDRSLFPHDPFKALVAPRPIGWIATMSAQGELNLAPYSYFNAFSSNPPIVGFSSEGEKDSSTFAMETGEFVWSMATWALRDQMNASAASLPRGESEFAHAGLETAPSRLVRPPRVAASPAAFECRVTEMVKLKDLDGRDSGRRLVLGLVVGVHLDERFVRDGRVDSAAMRPIARGGYDEYSVVERVFTMPRPA